MFHNDPASILKELPQYIKLDKYLKHMPARCGRAVFHPHVAEISRSFDIKALYREFADIRRHCDYELADEAMIKNGFLETVKELVIAKNCPIPADILRQIKDWRARGGVVYYFKGFPPVELETNAPAPLGTPVESLDFFGKNDGCFYTDHGDVVSKFNPAAGGIEFIKKQ